MSQTTTTTATMAISPTDKVFFAKLGERIATLRSERGLTQVQLAEILGYSQQQVLSFEKGRRRIPASALPALSMGLGVSVDELLDVNGKTTKRGPASKLQRCRGRSREGPPGRNSVTQGWSSGRPMGQAPCGRIRDPPRLVFFFPRPCVEL